MIYIHRFQPLVLFQTAPFIFIQLPSLATLIVSFVDLLPRRRLEVKNFATMFKRGDLFFDSLIRFDGIPNVI